MKKNLISIVAVVAIVAAATLSSCVSSLYSSTNHYDDLYAIHDVEVIAARQKAEAEVRQAEAEARRAEALALQAELEAELAKKNVTLAQNNQQVASAQGSRNAQTQSDGVIVVEEDNNSYVANTYESAYARRLRGFQSASYRMPSSYYSLRYDGRVTYATAYDPAYYNIMVSGDEVWVEPKYITSMFGTWGATRATVVLSPWYYGWGGWASIYDPWYYSGWGFPHYSWWDWNWNICYGSYWGANLWWGWGGIYRPWHHHYHYGWYGPSYHHHHHPGGFWYGDMWGGGGGGAHWRGGGGYYGSRDNGSRVNGDGRQPSRGPAVVNRGSSNSTPYRSPNSGYTYGDTSRAGRYASALEQQRNGSVGRGTTPNSSRTSATTSQSNGRSNSNQRSSAYDTSRSSSSSRNTTSTSSYSNSSSFSSGTRSSSSSFSGGGGFSGGGSRSGGSSSGSRGR